MALKDIVLKLKPEVDTKDLDRDLKRASESTAVALSKTVQEFENSTSQALKSLAADIESLDKNAGGDIFARATDAVDTFKNRLAEIEKSDTIDSMTLKMYKYEQSLSIAARSILSLRNDMEALNKSSQMRGTLISDYGSIENAKQRLKELRAEADAMMRDLQAQGISQAGPSIIGPMDEQMQKIQQLRQTLQDLKQDRKSLESSSMAGTPAWTRTMEDLDAQIKKTTSDLGLLTKEFYKMGRDAGWTGSNKDIMATYEQVKNMQDAYNEANNLSAALREVANNSMNANTTLGKLSEFTQNFERSADALHHMAEEAQKTDENVKKTGRSAEKTGASFNQWRNVVWSFSRLLGNVYTISLDIYRGARRIANMYMKIWNAAKKVLSVFKNLGKRIRGVADEHAKSFKQMLKDIFRYSFGIRSLFMLFRRLRKYIKEAFEAMASQIPEVNAMLASLKSSLYALKGSLATAFEPILSAIAPALVRLIDLLAQAITYIGMFFAALTGRGFVYQAKKVAQTIGDAAGNAKELNKQLQGFDELNNLTTNKGSGGGGDNPLAQFEKVDVPDWIENIAKKVKQLWDDILGPIKDAWAKVGDYVVAAWKRAFHSVKALLRDIVDDFVEAWKSGLGEIIATRFFEIIGDIGNIIANLAEKIREAWNYNNNGLKIWTAILTIVEKILTGVRNITIDIVKWTNTINLTPAMTAFKDWLESLIPIAELFMGILYDIWNDALKPILTWAFDGENSGIALFFKILKKFNDELDKSKLRENLDKIWQAVGRFGKTIGEGLLIFMNKMLGYLKDWLNSDDFTEWCQKVADFLDDIEPADIAETLDQVWRIIKNIAKEVYDVIQFVWDHRQDILDTLEWASTHIKEIAAVFLGGKLLIDVIRFVANIVLFGGAISKAFGAATAAAAGAEAAAGAAAGAAAAGATEVAGATAAAGAAAAETGGIMSGFVGTLAALASVLGSVALGYGIAIPAAKALDPILEENQLKVDDLKASMDDTIPTYDEMSQAAREASRNQKEYAEKMSDMYAQLLKTHPELQNLKDALEENGYKIGNNVDLLEQINDGFKVFNASGGDVQTTLSILAEKYGTVDQKAALFFNNLADGKEKCANVKDAVDRYNSTLEETKKKTEEAKEPNDNLIKVYKSEKEVLEDIQKGHDNVVGSFKTHWDIVNKQTTAVKENTDANRDYNSSNNELVGAMKTLEETLKELSEKFVGIKSSEEEVVDYKTIFGNAMGDMQTAMQDTSDTAAETGDNIVSGIKTPIENAKFDKETQSFFKTLFGDFQTAFDSHSPAKKMYPIGENILMGIVEGFKQKFDEFKKAIQNFYDNTVKPWFDPSKWTFDGVGQGLKETFEKAKNWIKTPINDMLGFMEKLVNGIIDGFNKMGDVLGSIDIDIPDWVPEIGGKSFEFKMPSLNHISIPRLAQGAVIPPNKEFLAVLGDQKSGTNIESPLSTMVEAFNQANKGGSEEEIALLQEQNELLRQLLQKDFSISEREVYRSVINQDSIRRKSTGRSAFAY